MRSGAIGLGHAHASAEVMSPRYGEVFRTLQPGDRSGAVALYGPNPAALQPPTQTAARN
jgi:hypothetical protein